MTEPVPFATRHRYFSPLKVVGELRQGRSLLRSLLNLAVAQHHLRGDVLDLGAKDGSGSYYRHLQVEAGTRIVFTDLEGTPEIASVDVEKPLPYADGSFDCVLALHLLEHVYDFRRLPSEAFRVLRPGGLALIAVPFLYEFHPDPDDYFRFTDSALKRLFESAGLQCEQLEAIGEGLLTACVTKLSDQVLPPCLRATGAVLAYLATTPFDRLVDLRPPICGKRYAVRFALEHLGVFRKPKPQARAGGLGLENPSFKIGLAPGNLGTSALSGIPAAAGQPPLR